MTSPGRATPGRNEPARAHPGHPALCGKGPHNLRETLTCGGHGLAATVPHGPSKAVNDYLLGVAGMWLDALSADRRAWFVQWFPVREP